MRRFYWCPLIILLTVMSLYGGFLYLPSVFDDTSFFASLLPNQYLSSFTITPRYIVHASLALTAKWFGLGMTAFRVQGVLWHAAVAIALFYFLRQVQREFLTQTSKQPSVAVPLVAAMVFALHPAAVYAAAYLIQRTIVMATFFALLSWICVNKGLQKDDQRWWWGSVVLYAMAVLCKEHAVMVPAVSVLLAVWWSRLHPDKATIKQLFIHHRWILVSYTLIALYTLIYSKSVVAYTYEPDATYSIDKLGLEHPWLLSVVTQGFLFFKYLFLWAVPNPLWMSVDMREPFAHTFISWPQTLGFLTFLCWPMVGVRLIFLSGKRAAIGFAMLAPWLLFATELATVRFNEIFVLYRSYLWLAPAFVIFLLLENKVSSKVSVAALFLIPVAMFPLAFNRISTFAHPFLLWNDAVRLTQKNQVVQGVGRTYYNRAIEFQRLKVFDSAIADFSEAIRIEPNFYMAYAGRASAYAELKEFDKAFKDFDLAIKYLSKYPLVYENKSRALKEVGSYEESERFHQAACELGWKDNCPTKEDTKGK